jgi:signal transduction histidine kinase
MVAIAVAAPIGRRFTYLVLGGALLLPFGVLGATVAALVPNLGTRSLADVVVMALVITVALPTFGLLEPVQQLELTAARELLRTPELPPAPRAGAARRRVGAWFAAHVVAGAVGSCALLSAVLGPVLIAERAGNGQLDRGAAVAAVPVAVLAGPGLAVLLGYALATLAPRALGPAPAERMELLQARAGELAHRNRLAREVHDSVGHALSVVTLQAAAARHVFDRDPEFARTALGAVEDTARAALTELDHVLGLLTDDSQLTDRKADPTTGTPSLNDLDALLERTRLTGVQVDADLDAARRSLPQLPAELSRQAYRMIQEAVTNAVRHGDGTSIAVRLSIDAEALRIDVHNRRAARTATRPTGRGLDGLHRRAQALGGTMNSGPAAETDPAAGPDAWHLAVQLPLPVTK